MRKWLRCATGDDAGLTDPLVKMARPSAAPTGLFGELNAA
jgi:hypothetical protein